jgi:hypothetical protein
MSKDELTALQNEPPWEPCAACRAPIFMARHERTGKRAPLLRPREGGLKPNIAAYQHAVSKQWLYRIVPYAPLDSDNLTLPGSQPPPEFINHFADCPAAAHFHKSK